MSKDHTEQIMVAVLDDMVRISVPRLLAIHSRMEKGATLLDLEIHFFTRLTGKLNTYSRRYHHDTEFMSLLGSVAHLLFITANLALENEESSVQNG